MVICTCQHVCVTAPTCKDKEVILQRCAPKGAGLSIREAVILPGLVKFHL